MRHGLSSLHVCVLVLGVLAPLQMYAKAKKKDSQQLRADYIARIEQGYVVSPESHTTGSLWMDHAPLGDISSDYKAHLLNDTVNIQVAVQTTAAQSGTVDSERSFSTNSALTGLFGKTPASTNPLLSGQSASVLKGQGAAASNTTFTTSLTANVVAVLPNGNMIIEAQRNIFMNNQHEDLIVRGMIRPGDIGPGNVVPSSALSDLEIEMKGKGIIADGVRPPNRLTRALLWLFNF
ncbi:MAG: flagellar basal body L-ring protein FlgH [Acidobacteriota bacterium]